MRKESPEEIIKFWRSEYNGELPKDKIAILQAMAHLLELLDKKGIDPEVIESSRVANLVAIAGVHQGKLTASNRLAWKKFILDRWELSVSKWKWERTNGHAAPPPASVIEIKVEKPQVDSPPAKIEPIKPEERLDQSMFDPIIPDEPEKNTELLDFFKKN